MNKKLLLIISIIAILGFWASKTLIKKDSSKDKTSVTKMENSVYWTCPMHPQVHMEHEGECPICHMKLVKVTKQNQGNNINDGDTADNRTSVFTTKNQLDLIGLQKVQAEKMDLTTKIGISGRALSASAVAFQVYESDLRVLKVGLPFKGIESVSSEDVSGIITSIDSLVDPTSRTVRVIGSIKNSSTRLLPETSFSGEILILLKDRLAIPESSVLHTGKGALVYIVEKNNKLNPTFIKLGAKTEGFYEVISGLTDGQFISSGPNFLIDSEAKIRGAND